MKAITLYQPWASLMAYGIKHNETRGWRTSHRGPLLICSAARKPDVETVLFVLRRAAIAAQGEQRNLLLDMLRDRTTWMISSTALAVVHLFNCEASDDVIVSPVEHELGEYGSHRFVWLCAYLKRLEHPFRVIGRQRLFSIDLNQIPIDSMRELMAYEHQQDQRK